MKPEIKIHHIECKVYIMKTIEMQDSLEKIAQFVYKALCMTKKGIELHNKNQFKNYCISGFREIEKDKKYKEGKLYSFCVRCIDENMSKNFQKDLPKVETKEMKGIICNAKIISELYIDKLYTITPAIVTLQQGGYWKRHINLEEYEKQLFNNCIKKYNAYFNTQIDENFKLYDSIKFLNNLPIASTYKGIKLLGDKFELKINSDDSAQNMAYFLLGVGVCTKNTAGFGYMNYKSL